MKKDKIKKILLGIMVVAGIFCLLNSNVFAAVRPAKEGIILGNGSSNTTKVKKKYIDIDLTGGVNMSQKPSVPFYSTADVGGKVYNSIAPAKGTKLISMKNGKQDYYSQGGSVSGQWENNKKKTFTLNAVDATCMTPHIRLPKVTKTGYTFTGWSVTKTENCYSWFNGGWVRYAKSNKGVQYGSDGYYYINVGAYSNIRTVKPNFQINNYTLYFNANGGSVYPSSRSVTYGSQYGTLPTPSRSGYSFSGWYTAPSGGSRVYNTTTMGAGNTTIYAHWTPNNYYLDLNGILDGVSGGNISGFGTADIYVNGSLVANDVTDYYSAHPYGSSYSITDIKAVTGKRYNGVYSGSTSGTIWGNTSTTLSFSTASYNNSISHWMWGFKNGEGNNGSKNAFNMGTTTFSAKYNSSYVMDSTRKMTIPKGFYISDSFGTSNISGSWGNYPFGTRVTQKPNIMYYEYDYSPITYHLTYNLDGGTLPSGQTNPSSYNVLYGVTFKNPVREGYKFLGWYIDGQKVTGINPGANATFSSPTDMYNKLNSRTIGDKTVEARWQIDTCVLTFDPNGGTVNPTSKKVNCHKPYGELPVPTRKGYDFLGWFTAKDGGSQVTEETIMGTKDVTVYAHWKVIHPTLTVKKNYYFQNTTVSINDIKKNASANDVVEGDISNKITIESITYPNGVKVDNPTSFSTSQLGNIKIVYKVENERGGTTVKEGTIKIIPLEDPDNIVINNDIPKIYSRFISNEILADGRNSKETLAQKSVWKSGAYKALLDSSLNKNRNDYLTEYDYVNSSRYVKNLR